MTMAVARQRHDRALVVAHYKLIGSLFDEDSKMNLAEFIQRGSLGAMADLPLPSGLAAAVERKVAEIHANGGRFTG